MEGEWTDDGMRRKEWTSVEVEQHLELMFSHYTAHNKYHFTESSKFNSAY